MPFDNYANLQASVLAYLNRSTDADAVVRCPDWITLAEDVFRMSLSDLKVRQGETQNASFAISTEYTALPADWYATRTIVLNTAPIQGLSYVTPVVADNWDIYATPGRPKLYTIQNKQLRVFPAPDIAYTAKFTYFSLPSLTTLSPTNWLLTAHPRLYLFAALAEAHAYYSSLENYSAFSSERERMLDNIYTSDGSDKQGGNAMRMRVSTGTP